MSFSFEQFARWAAKHSDLVPAIIDASKQFLDADCLKDKAKILADVMTKCGDALDELFHDHPEDSLASSAVADADLREAYEFLSYKLSD